MYISATGVFTSDFQAMVFPTKKKVLLLISYCLVLEGVKGNSALLHLF